MRPKPCFRVLQALLLSTAFAWISTGEQRQLQLGLTASSPFRMVISRTGSELESKALRLIEKAAANHLLEQSLIANAASNQEQKETVKAVEIVIQVSEFQAELAATTIKFFALATFNAVAGESTLESAPQAEREAELNALIDEAFSTATKSDLFLRRVLESVIVDNDIATSEQLQDLDSVVVASVVPAPSNGTGGSSIESGKSLSSLDKILIAVSTGILVGIIWMIILYYKDLGYFVSDPNPHAVLSSAAGSFPQAEYEAEMDLDEESVADAEDHLEPNIDAVDQKHDASDSTPSTPNTSDGTYSPDFSFPALNSVELHSHEVSGILYSINTSTQGQLDVTASSAASEVPFLNLSEDPFVPSCPSFKSDSSDGSKEVLSLSEPFETNVFRTAPLSDSGRKSIATTGSDGSVPNKSAGDSTSDGSDDVFQVDIAAAESATGDSASRHSATQDITDWMNSIHVVTMSGDRSTSVMTASTDGQTSERSSGNKSSDKSALESTLLEVSSLGHVSLERSMASSTPSAGDATKSTDDV